MSSADPPPAEALQPDIELPRDAVPLPLLIGIVLVLALGLFLYLNANRQAMLSDIEGAGKNNPASRLPAPPPDLLIPPAPPEVVPAPVIIRDPGPAAVQRPQPAPQPVALSSPMPRATAAPPRLRGNEPPLVVDLTAGTGAQVAGAAGTAADMAGDDTVRATLIRNRSSIIPQGAIIQAVLETPLNSDRPGLARAIISQDARSFDGSRVLIPRGSRLIGEFKAETGAGLRRVLVTWTRLIRPDGVAIRIQSPVTDAMGGAGVPGSVNTHFLERFGSAVLQSALTIGVNLASLPRDSGSVYVGLPATAAQVGQQLVPTTQRAPTVKVREGAQIAVLVARDLDFGGTPAVR